MPDHNEPILLYKLRKGSAEAFECIFKLHWPRLYRIARSKLQSHTEAEEIIQGIFSSLWEKHESLQITNLTAYLNAALKNRILNLIRSRISEEKYWNYYQAFFPRNQEHTDEVVAFDTLTEAVEEAVNQLPEKSRQVFKLSRMEGRSNAEIARVLHLSEKSIEYHITRSLRQLKLYLKDYTLLAFLAVFS